MQELDLTPIGAGELTATGNSWEGWCWARATRKDGGRPVEGIQEFLPHVGDREPSARFPDNVRGLLADTGAERLEVAMWDVARLERMRHLARLLAVQAVGQDTTR